MTDELRIDVARYVAAFEREGLVTRTFRRLDPDRQRAVLDAILDEAAERGPEDVNVKHVAERAGVSVGSLYQYFGTREALLDFAVELSVRFMVETLAAARPYLVALPLADALRTYLSVGVDWGRTEAGLMRFLARAAYRGGALEERAVRPIATQMRLLVAAMLAAAGERGELRPGLDVDSAARLVNALAIAVADGQLFPYLNAYFQITDESMPPERLLDGFVDFVLAAVAEV
jgi:AcrR family transcriptional regulator